MPNKNESGLETPINIHMKVVGNGVSVEGSCEEHSVDYVYTSLDKALKEIPGIVSVLKEYKKKITEKDLDKEEERINKSQETEDY